MDQDTQPKQSDPRALVLRWEKTLSLLHYPAILCLLCPPRSVWVPAGSRWHTQNRVTQAEFNEGLTREVWARGQETAWGGGTL